MPRGKRVAVNGEDVAKAHKETGNFREAAKKLKISPATAYRLMRNTKPKGRPKAIGETQKFLAAVKKERRMPKGRKRQETTDGPNYPKIAKLMNRVFRSANREDQDLLFDLVMKIDCRNKIRYHEAVVADLKKGM